MERREVAGQGVVAEVVLGVAPDGVKVARGLRRPAWYSEGPGAASIGADVGAVPRAPCQGTLAVESLPCGHGAAASAVRVVRRRTRPSLGAHR